ncbi:TPA: hypothetical protein ACIEK7_000565, partial [Streptococcus pyogenes]
KKLLSNKMIAFHAVIVIIRFALVALQNRPSNRLLKTTTFNRTLTDKKKNHNIHNMMIIFFYLIIDGRIFYDR